MATISYEQHTKIIKLLDDKVFYFAKYATQEGNINNCEPADYLVKHLKIGLSRGTIIKFFGKTTLGKDLPAITAKFYKSLRDCLVQHNILLNNHEEKGMYYEKCYVDDDNFKLINEVIEQLSSKEPPSKDLGLIDLGLINDIYSNSLIPRDLKQTSWYLFERIEDKRNKIPLRWGIGVGLLKFLEENSRYLEVIMSFKKVKKEFDARSFKGLAVFDLTKKTIFIDLVEDGNIRRRSSIVLHNIQDLKNNDIFFGHYTYCSTKDERLQYTKSVLLIKNSSTEIGAYWENEKNFQDIEDSIKNFLFNREKNRMSSPHRRFETHLDLQQFLDDRNQKILSSRLNSVINDYWVYYKGYADENITEDSVNIRLEQGSGKCVAIYTHISESRKFKGEVFINKNSVSLEMSNIKIINQEGKIYLNEREEDPILLSFLLPKNQIKDKETDFYSGVISGLYDEDREPVAYLVILVKKTRNDFERGNDKIVTSFFSKKQNIEIRVNQE